jgi:hypothetical protein
MGGLMMDELTVSENREVDVVDDSKIMEAVAFINEVANKTIYQGSIEIGDYILKHFFEDDIKFAASKNPKKQASFNKLCENEDLTIRPNRLAIMVRVASQERFLAEKEVDTSELTYTHKASFVKLDNGQKKINLIKKCVDKEWSTRELDIEINKKIKELPLSRKPSILLTTKKCITKVDDVLKTVDGADFEVDVEALITMSDKKRKDLEKFVKELKKKVEDTATKSEKISADCDGLLGRIAEADKERKNNPPKRGRKPSKSSEN